MSYHLRAKAAAILTVLYQQRMLTEYSASTITNQFDIRGGARVFVYNCTQNRAVVSVYVSNRFFTPILIKKNWKLI